jgi:hypothetical protein
MLQEIADRVYVELDYEGANVGCVLTEEGAIVIDTPIIPEQARHWASTISMLADKVLYVFNTDHHRAHIMGNQFFDTPVLQCWLTKQPGGKCLTTKRPLLNGRKTCSKNVLTFRSS